MTAPTALNTILIDALQRSHDRLNHILDQVGNRWETPVQPDEQRWTVRQMLGHLVDANRGMAGMVTAWATGLNPVPPDFDLNRWNKLRIEKAGSKTPDDFRAALNAAHEQLIAQVDGLSPDDLQKIGRHSSLINMTVEQLLNVIAAHEMTHTAEIERALLPETNVEPRE